MKKTNTCPKCASRNIIVDAKAIDRADDNWQRELSVATFSNPEALIMKGQRETTVSAWVCGECGYIEFYADHPKTLQERR
jgi:predicted nucleic-acid-binding Zn-ribbon protein